MFVNSLPRKHDSSRAICKVNHKVLFLYALPLVLTVMSLQITRFVFCGTAARLKTAYYFCCFVVSDLEAVWSGPAVKDNEYGCHMNGFGGRLSVMAARQMAGYDHYYVFGDEWDE